MTPEQLKQAIDEAYLEQLKQMFSVLVEGMLLESKGITLDVSDKSTAIERFNRGTTLLGKARIAATSSLGLSSRG